MSEELFSEEDYLKALEEAAAEAAESGDRVTRQESDMEMIQKWVRLSINKYARSWLLDEKGQAFSADAYGPGAARRIPMSDLTAARELRKCFDGTIHFAAQSRVWYIWNGIFHEKIDGDMLAYWITESFVDAQKWALQQVKKQYEVAASALQGKAASAKMAEYSQGLFKEHRMYRDRAHNHGGFTALGNNMRGKFSVEDSHFINDQRWLVFWNGVIDLDELVANPPAPGDLGKIKLLPHDPRRAVWRCIEADFNPSAVAPAWQERYLARSQPNAELRKFLAVTAGAAMIGQSKIKTIPVLTGPRDSGKTVFTDTMSSLFGGYGGQPDTTAINKGSGTNFEQDRLRGLRFVAISEPNTDRKVDESFLKKYTGGDVLSTRNLNAKSAEWKSQGVIFFATNIDLKFNTADNAIVSRLATVRFPHRFYRVAEVPPGKEDYLIDYTLEGDIQKEFSGIVNWVLNGALAFLAEGVKIPEAVIDYRREQVLDGSSTLSWLEHVKSGDSPYVLDPVAGRRVNKSEYADLKSVHMSYSMWCMEEGETIVPKKAFAKELREALEIDEFIRSGVVRVQRLSLEPEIKTPVIIQDDDS
jgi:P4 family phage/plasmid primase-like protien